MRETVGLHVNPRVPDEPLHRLLSTHFAGTPLEGTPETEDDYATGVVVDEDEWECEFDDFDLPEPDDYRYNGDIHIAKYDLVDVVVIIETGTNTAFSIEPAQTTIWDYLQGWEFGDGVTPDEGLAAFGFDEGPDVAKAGATDVRIWRRPFYTERLLPESYAGYVCDEAGEPLVFGTTEDARAWIEEADSETYILSHGEYERPDYTVVD